MAKIGFMGNNLINLDQIEAYMYMFIGTFFI